MKLSSRVWMWVFGLAAIGGLALFLTLFQSSPGPLSAPHARAAPGNFIWSCEKCHADEGLEAGCLSCHEEINEQLVNETGFHALLKYQSTAGCAECHPDHHGADFPLVSKLSWKDIDTNNFSHPHVEFVLTGAHNDLSCDQCHNEQFHASFALAEYPDQSRPHSMLGLKQECIACHEDIHGGREKTRNCTQCHNQDAFKPAPYFDHSRYYVLEGPHAKAACSACHQADTIPATALDGTAPTFGPVKGKGCADCHDSPHRFESARQRDCLACHRGADETWSKGRRGVDAAYHQLFGFKLKGAHATVECAKCHLPELAAYTERYPEPSAPGYSRREGQCRSCHADPHSGQFDKQNASCSMCHTTETFMPSTMGTTRHAEVYPLVNGHLAVPCIRCHTVDPASKVRQFTGTTTFCKECHSNPHGNQFDHQIRENDCAACHKSDFSDFKVDTYKHHNMRDYFRGQGHVQADCAQCHAYPATDREILVYQNTPTACSGCHTDIHRGQFRQQGQTHCERCHDSYDEWSAKEFDHNRHTSFMLDKAHAKVECNACHLPVRQPDNQWVTQYRPLTTKCEDCHGFQKE